MCFFEAQGKVGGWWRLAKGSLKARFETPRAQSHGFRHDPDIETVIRDYIADEAIRVK